MSNLLLARLVVVALAVAYILAVLAYNVLLFRYRNDAIRRVAIGLPIIVFLIGVLFAQLESYSNLTGIRKPIDDDGFFFFIFIVENVVVIACIFYGAFRRRKTT
jgi:hypothetical protein